VICTCHNFNEERKTVSNYIKSKKGMKCCSREQLKVERKNKQVSKKPNESNEPNMPTYNFIVKRTQNTQRKTQKFNKTEVLPLQKKDNSIAEQIYSKYG
jgi:hypothetical protein